jgi:drug/metabolite transporter (DMT)-like permease
MTENGRGERIKLWAAFGAIYFLWGANFLAIRYAALAMPPLLMMATRSLIAGALLFGWARLRGEARPAPGQWPAAVAVGMLLFLGCHGLLAWAERTVPSGIAALVLATIPVWLTLFDWASRGPRPRRLAVIGLALGFLGLTALIGRSPGEGAPLVSLLALVLSAVAWALGSILSRRLPRSPNLVMASGMQLLSGGTALAVVGLALGEAGRIDTGALAPRALLSFGYMVVASSLVGFTAYMWLLRVSTPSRVGTYAFVNPMVALCVGSALGGESLDGRTLFASLVILAGVALIVVAGGRKPGERTMIARVWKGTTKTERAEEYLEYLKRTGVAECRSTAGNRGVSIERRTSEAGAEFVFTSRWDSWEAIRRFAGPEPEKAVYYPEDREFLLSMDPHVEHFEVLVDERA